MILNPSIGTRFAGHLRGQFVTGTFSSRRMSGAEINNGDESLQNIIFENINDKSVITLNRPKYLHAITFSMLQALHENLRKWETTKKLIIVKSSGNRAFCAGGDVSSLCLLIEKNGDGRLIQPFVKTMYSLDYLIHTYKVPYVALMNGISMGAGNGISINGTFRVATENTTFAMPEVALGLFPDVSGTYFLSRLKGKLGLYLGLTGNRLKGSDLVASGLATHYVPSERLEDLTKALLESEATEASEILEKFQPANLQRNCSLEQLTRQIDYCFSGETIEEILERLESDNSKWANDTLKRLTASNPISLKITKQALERGGKQNILECLKIEYRLACWIMHDPHNMLQGWKSVLVDKNFKPEWRPKNLANIKHSDVLRYFDTDAELTDIELDLQLDETRLWHTVDSLHDRTTGTLRRVNQR